MPAASLVRLILLAAIWGGSFLFMRIAVPAFGPVQMAFGRVALATLGLAALLVLLRVPMRFHGRLRATLMLGAINSGLPFLMFALAAQALPAGYSAILNATAPMMGAAIGFAAFGERPTWRKLGGIAAGLAGVAVLARAGPIPLDRAVIAGVLECLLATTCYGLAVYLTRRWIGERGGLDSRHVALGSQLGAVVLLLVPALWDAGQHPVAWHAVDASAWLALATLGLLCTSLAYVLYFRLIADVGPLKALTVTFLVPAFGVLWGWLFLGESVGFAHLAGAGLIAVALWLVLRPAGDRPDHGRIQAPSSTC